MNDPWMPLRLAAAVVTAVVFLAGALAARGTCEVARPSRIPSFAAP